MQRSATAAARIAAPSFVPADAVLDTAHLAHMTLGEQTLQREVLALFDRQLELLLARMQVAAAPAVAMLAHTLEGSARGIGAWQVASAAEAVEQAAGAGRGAELAVAIARLATAANAARAAIAELLAERS
jgi:Hpt domain